MSPCSRRSDGSSSRSSFTLRSSISTPVICGYAASSGREAARRLPGPSSTTREPPSLSSCRQPTSSRRRRLVLQKILAERLLRLVARVGGRARGERREGAAGEPERRQAAAPPGESNIIAARSEIQRDRADRAMFAIASATSDGALAGSSHGCGTARPRLFVYRLPPGYRSKGSRTGRGALALRPSRASARSTAVTLYRTHNYRTRAPRRLRRRWPTRVARATRPPPTSSFCPRLRPRTRVRRARGAPSRAAPAPSATGSSAAATPTRPSTGSRSRRARRRACRTTRRAAAPTTSCSRPSRASAADDYPQTFEVNLRNARLAGWTKLAVEAPPNHRIWASSLPWASLVHMPRDAPWDTAPWRWPHEPRPTLVALALGNRGVAKKSFQRLREALAKSCAARARRRASGSPSRRRGAAGRSTSPPS